MYAKGILYSFRDVVDRKLYKSFTWLLIERARRCLMSGDTSPAERQWYGGIFDALSI